MQEIFDVFCLTTVEEPRPVNGEDIKEDPAVDSVDQEGISCFQPPQKYSGASRTAKVFQEVTNSSEIE